MEPSVHRHGGSQPRGPRTLSVAEQQPGRTVKISKWSSIPLWLLTGANHKRHFNSPSHILRKMMSSPLSKELRQRYNIRSMFIQKNDEVQDVQGHLQRAANWQSSSVYRKKYGIHIDRVQQEKRTVQLPMWAFTPASWLSLD